jgi:hypothetical protein
MGQVEPVRDPRTVESSWVDLRTQTFGSSSAKPSWSRSSATNQLSRYEIAGAICDPPSVTDPASTNTRDHHVPQMYLRRFGKEASKGARIGVATRDLAQRFVTSVRDVAGQFVRETGDR